MKAVSSCVGVLVSALYFSTAAFAVPVANIGDQFSGTLTINPSASCSSCTTNPDFVYETYYNAGSISLNLDGTHWAGGSLYIEVSYQPGLAQWAGSTASGDGISIILDGSTRSTSILPLGLSNYQVQPVVKQISFQAQADNGDVYSYAGNFTSLTQLDDTANFSFEGSITDFSIFTPSVPESSTWAMMLLGFAGVGFVMRFRRVSALAVADQAVAVDPR